MNGLRGRTTDEDPRTARVLVDKRLLPKRFLVASNRLPYSLARDGDEIRLRRGVGGLVTALDPILRLTGGTWIGWSGTYEDMPTKIPVDEEEGCASEYYLAPVKLSREDIERYYLGYSNKCLWPLFHYFQEHCEFNHDLWESYKEVNRRFADAILEEYREGDMIWIHDYHLMLVPAWVRQELPRAKIGFFLHIPFPSAEICLVEPHAGELIAGVLGSDLIGFQLDANVYNFMDSMATLTHHRYSRGMRTVNVDDRLVRLRSFPISIDFDYFAEVAEWETTEERARQIRASYRAETLALGVDRLDYTKGIPERLRAIEVMLDRNPELQGRFTFIQLSAPSRTKVEAYRAMREEVERLVGHVNGRFGGKGCIPIDYRYEVHSQEELVAFYRAADLALVTPLRDGMNLVAKEYLASRSDEDCMLVLSRFAGAAHELVEAISTNPYDPESMAEHIHGAITMSREERRRRMRAMRELVRRNDIYWWLERFLRDLS
jgi:alpha,alpha-trehalose-phosphate synthase [UDP-forming]